MTVGSFRYAVEHGAGSRGLGKVRGFAGLDGKLPPVDDGTGAVGHRQNIADLVRRHRAPLTTEGISPIRQHRGADEARGDGGNTEPDGRRQTGKLVTCLRGGMLVAHVNTPRAEQPPTRYSTYSAKNHCLPCSKSHFDGNNSRVRAALSASETEGHSDVAAVATLRLPAFIRAGFLACSHQAPVPRRSGR
jgi:hypothetical protein